MLRTLATPVSNSKKMPLPPRVALDQVMLAPIKAIGNIKFPISLGADIDHLALGKPWLKKCTSHGVDR